MRLHAKKNKGNVNKNRERKAMDSFRYSLGLCGGTGAQGSTTGGDVVLVVGTDHGSCP